MEARPKLTEELFRGGVQYSYSLSNSGTTRDNPSVERLFQKCIRQHKISTNCTSRISVVNLSSPVASVRDYCSQNPQFPRVRARLLARGGQSPPPKAAPSGRPLQTLEFSCGTSFFRKNQRRTATRFSKARSALKMLYSHWTPVTSPLSRKIPCLN